MKTHSTDRRGDFCSGDDRGKKILAKFVNTTSLHGVSCVVLSTSLPVHCFWKVIFLSAVGMFTFQLTKLIQRYVSDQKKISIEVVDNDADVSWVTVCNMLHLDIGAIVSGKFVVSSEACERYFENYKSVETNLNEMIAHCEDEEQFKELTVLDTLNETYSPVTLSANFCQR